MVVLIDQLLPELHPGAVRAVPVGLESLAIRNVDVRDDNVRGTARWLIGIFNLAHSRLVVTAQLGPAACIKNRPEDFRVFAMRNCNEREVLTRREAG